MAECNDFQVILLPVASCSLHDEAVLSILAVKRQQLPWRIGMALEAAGQLWLKQLTLSADGQTHVNGIISGEQCSTLR